MCSCLFTFVALIQKNKVIPMETINIPANITSGSRNTTLCIQRNTSVEGSDIPVSRGTTITYIDIDEYDVTIKLPPSNEWYNEIELDIKYNY